MYGLHWMKKNKGRKKFLKNLGNILVIYVSSILCGSKMESNIILHGEQIGGRIQRREKELIPKLVEECMKWAIENSLKKKGPR